MNNNKISENDRIMKGLEKAYNKMLEFKKKMNSELVIMKDGKIVKIKL